MKTETDRIIKKIRNSIKENNGKEALNGKEMIMKLLNTNKKNILIIEEILKE